jgi:uncharacterized protein YjbI with pentapeptide repeats
MDDAGESGAAEQTPPKIRVEDNPWYLLATLYGVPDDEDRELQTKNRVAWNRYCAENLDEQTRAKLIEEKRHPAEELTPLSAEELQEVAGAFAERCKTSTKKLALPASDADIDFSNVEFEQDAFFRGYLFSRHSSFLGVTFSLADFGGATFSGGTFFAFATFSGRANFAGATFSSRASFSAATFSQEAIFGYTAFGEAYFNRATFSGWANFGGATFSEASFGGSTFSGGASFVNAEMKGETFLEGAIFKTEPPHFFGAKLHQGTVWRGIKSWPLPSDKIYAGRSSTLMLVSSSKWTG